MKRSEILEEIAEHFDAYVFSAIPKQRAAEYLLTKLESLGMAPPDSDYYRSSLGHPNRVWEPEDEKNNK